MNRSRSNAWFIMLLGIILIIPASFVILKPYINTENYENRELAKFPSPGEVSWYKMPKALDDYVLDHFPYRNYFVLTNSLINTEIFDDNPGKNTIKGREGWIFYTGENNNSLMQYKGVSTYSEEQLERIADNLIASRDYLGERDCSFILFIAPNKERVYSEYMPDEIKRSSEYCNTDQLIGYLNENTDIKVIWAYESLMEYKGRNPDMPLYYHYDTHWNNLGAFTGVKALCDELSVDIPGVSLERNGNSSYDLADYSGLRLVLTGKDTDYDILGLNDEYEIEEEEINGRFIFHNSGEDERRLMVLRDSFAINMRSCLGSLFNETDMPHRNVFEQSMIDDFNPDIFVYETCERDLDRLLDFRLE